MVKNNKFNLDEKRLWVLNAYKGGSITKEDALRALFAADITNFKVKEKQEKVFARGYVVVHPNGKLEPNTFLNCIVFSKEEDTDEWIINYTGCKDCKPKKVKVVEDG